MTAKKSAYAEAGVDIDVMMSALRKAKRAIRQTATASTLSETGAFGGLFRSPGSGLLVSSIDGVGTKLKVAHLAGRHDTVGRDLVNHCVNDILVQGARPLFFMDYVGAARLEPEVFVDVVRGLCRACRENGCALIGGETAEMPGLYPESEYDLVGSIVGYVDKQRLVTGRGVRPGDVIIGLASSGLHTNGYSLARRILFDTCGLDPADPLPGGRRSAADILLAVHRSYLHPVQALMKEVNIRAMAHITGGGLTDNIPRVLPKKTGAVIDRARWTPAPVFHFLQDAGNVDTDEMYRVFNMGIGYVIMLRPEDAETALSRLKRMRVKAAAVGYIERTKKTAVRYL